ncbi:hypothetical protein [Qipengyuania sp. 483]
MFENKADPADPSARFDSIEILLNRYPDVSDEEVVQLKRWFGKQASAFEIASMASKNPAGYGQFRSDHIDKFTIVEMVLIALFAGAIVSIIVLVL